MRYWIIVFAALLISAGTAQAGSGNIGLVKTLKGQAAIERGGRSLPAEIGLKLMEKDVLVTGAGSSLGIIMRDNSVVSIGSFSRLELTEFIFEPADKKLNFVSKMLKGTAVYLTGIIAKLNQNSVRVETPMAVAGVRGTRFAISVKGD
ncbi:MAG: FecR family protein [Pseudomonadota bacterium]